MIGSFRETFWSPEPITAYRGWTHFESGSGLVGPHGIVWQSSFLTAVHRGGDHDAPHPGCNCGINAWKTPLGPRQYHILGRVELSGNVDEYETGYRAAEARIKELAIYFRYESTVPVSELPDLIATSGPFPKEDVDREMEQMFQVPVQRIKRIPWRPENHEETIKEVDRWQK